MTSIVTPSQGIVRLEDKLIPVCDRSDVTASDNFAFTRADLDISLFKAKLLSLPPSAWDDENQDGNVKLNRPAHDAWGIKKIVFNFCDDFLLKTFDLPWSQSEEWRQHLLPIYKAIGIDEKQVVRCLLASMPPGMTIPVHHDTGYWVKHTHRCHVPIVTSPEVDFLVGPNEKSMRKVLFDEGKVVELNNQAKHSVVNNMKGWRIHLIFDYVDSHPISRYKLKPGEKLNQTRRSIDLATEEGSRKAPSFIIIGAQKSGTTSIYELLCQHPLVLRGKRRETHYFDWRWNEELAAASAEEQHAYYMNYFNAEALAKYPSLLTGESTPSYLLHSDLALPRLRSVCPWARVIAVLRDPTDRAYSHYQMSVDTQGTPEQLAIRGMSSYVGRAFTEVVEEEIAELETMGIQPESSYEEFRDKFLSTRSHLKHGGHSLVARGLYALQLQPWLAAYATVTDQGEEGEGEEASSAPSSGGLLIATMGQLRGGRAAVQATMDRVFAHVGLPPHDLEEADVAPRNTRPYPPLDPETRQRLDDYYAPFNVKIMKILNTDKLNW